MFCGQLPFEVTTADVQNLFSQYATSGGLRSCQVVSGPDGRSKGCAMIMFNTWTEAELAVEGENNTTHLGGTKPMVVKFADPPKRGDGPIMGIAPKKLFVGQVCVCPLQLAGTVVGWLASGLQGGMRPTPQAQFRHP